MIENCAQRINIALNIVIFRLTNASFRRDIARRTQHLAGDGQFHFAVEQFSQTKIRYPRLVHGIKEQVRWFKIPMHNSMLMSVMNRFRDFLQIFCGAMGRKGFFTNDICEAFALDKFHRKKSCAIALTNFMYCHDVGMPQARYGISLGLETFYKIGTGKWAMEQHLDSDDAIETTLDGFVNNTHSTPRNLFQ